MSRLDELRQTKGWHAATGRRDVKAIARWLGCSLPTDYAEFAETSDGFEGFFGESYLVLHDPRTLTEWQIRYRMSENFPGFVQIGTDGAGEMICLDVRGPTPRYALVPAIGCIEDAADLGTSLEQMLEKCFRGTWLG